VGDRMGVGGKTTFGNEAEFAHVQIAQVANKTSTRQASQETFASRSGKYPAAIVVSAETRL
jgi:hypothetical protein